MSRVIASPDCNGVRMQQSPPPAPTTLTANYEIYNEGRTLKLRVPVENIVSRTRSGQIKWKTKFHRVADKVAHSSFSSVESAAYRDEEQIQTRVYLYTYTTPRTPRRFND